MRIIIKTKDGKINITSSIHPREHVTKIKNIIKENVFIPIDQQRLIFEGELLKDDNMICYYEFYDESEILLVDTYESLLKLGPTNTYIENNNLIQKSIINLEKNPQLSDSKNLLIESLSYLDEEISFEITKSLFKLIICCLKSFPSESYNIIDKRLQKKAVTSYHLLMVASILSNYQQLRHNNNEKPIISIDDYKEFINKSLNDIITQSKISDKSELTILGYKIKPEFKKDFITDIILLSGIDKQIVSEFSPFFFTKTIPFSKLEIFINEVKENELLESITEQTFLTDNLFLQFTPDIILHIISISSDQTFKNIGPLIEQNIDDDSKLSKIFSSKVADKWINLNVKIQKTELFLNNFTNYKNRKFFEYLYANDIKISNKIITEKEYPKLLFDIILKEDEPNKNRNLYILMFRLLMSDEFISTKYATIQIERYTNDLKFEPKTIFTKLDFLYKSYKSDIIYVLQTYYAFSKNQNIFIKKLNPTDTKDLKKPSIEIIKDATKNKDYKNFIFLQNIVSSFPFLVDISNYQNSEESPSAAFITLPYLNCFALFFDKVVSEDNMNALKTAASALSFLFSCLYSTKFLSIFVPWLFKNITKLSDSQVVFMSHILLSLFETRKINRIVLGYAIQFKFLKILNELLRREIPNGPFSNYYFKILYELSIKFIDLSSGSCKFDDAFFIDEMNKHDIKNPFETEFNGLSIISDVIIKPINITFEYESEVINQISLFFKEIGYIQPYWIFYDPQTQNGEVNKAINLHPSSGVKPADTSASNSTSISIPSLTGTKAASEYPAKPNASYNINLGGGINPIGSKQTPGFSFNTNTAATTTNPTTSAFSFNKSATAATTTTNPTTPAFSFNTNTAATTTNPTTSAFSFNTNTAATTTTNPTTSAFSFNKSAAAAATTTNPTTSAFSFNTNTAATTTNPTTSAFSFNKSATAAATTTNPTTSAFSFNKSAAAATTSFNKGTTTSAPTQAVISEFLKQFTECTSFVDENKFKIPNPLSVKMQRYLQKEPKWVMNYIDNTNSHIPILSEHHEILKEVSAALNKIDKKPTNNEDDENVAYKNCETKLINLQRYFNYICDDFDSFERIFESKSFCDQIFLELKHSDSVRKFFYKMIVKFISSDGYDYKIFDIKDFIERARHDLLNNGRLLNRLTFIFSNIDKIKDKEALEQYELLLNQYKDSKQKCLELNGKIQAFKNIKETEKEKQIEEITIITKYIDNNFAPKRDRFQSDNDKSNDTFFDTSIDQKLSKSDNLFLYDSSKDHNDRFDFFKFGIYNKYREFISYACEKKFMNFENSRLLDQFFELVPFEHRLSVFKEKLKELRDKNKNKSRINMSVSRQNILIDSFNKLHLTKPEDLFGDFRVDFIGEKGIDAGGLTKEWFTFVVREFFNGDFALFMKLQDGVYHTSPLSSVNEEHIEYLRVAGEIIALALIRGQCVSAHLSKALLRQILHQKPYFYDVKEYDDGMFNSMKNTLFDPGAEDLEMTFTITEDNLGKVETINLIENGDKIDVTDENKKLYVELYTDYRLRKSMIKQIDAFCKGFESLIPPEMIKHFTPEELSSIICGKNDFDVEDFRRNVKYEGPYNANHPTIVMFFNVISKWNQENLSKLLQFITGTSHVPVNGFKDFTESSNPITITYVDNKNKLPSAHTCFNKFDLPQYDNEDVMNEKLITAVNNCNDFGMG